MRGLAGGGRRALQVLQVSGQVCMCWGILGRGGQARGGGLEAYGSRLEAARGLLLGLEQVLVPPLAPRSFVWA